MSGDDLLYCEFIQSIITESRREVNEFRAGCIGECLPVWEELTSDQQRLQIVRGYQIDLKRFLKKRAEPRSIQFGDEEKAIVSREVKKLLEKRVYPIELKHGRMIPDISPHNLS